MKALCIVLLAGIVTAGILISCTKSPTAPAGPPAPPLVAPANDTTNQFVPVTLSWGSVAFAVSYNMQVSATSSFSSTVFEQAGYTSDTVTVGALVNSTTYYWHVNAANGSGTGTWANAWRFTTVEAAPAAPVPATPVNGAADQGTILTVGWTASTGATSYEVQIATESAFAATVSSQTGLTADSATVSGLDYGTTYYWRINATNTGGSSTWSEVWSFATLAVPAAPVLPNPANGATDQTAALTLGWAASASAESYSVRVSTEFRFRDHRFGPDRDCDDLCGDQRSRVRSRYLLLAG